MPGIKAILIYVLFFILLSCFTAYNFLTRHKTKPCYGTFSQVRGNEKLTLSSVLTFDGNHGRMEMTGDYYVDNVKTEHVARMVHFRFFIENEQLSVISESVSVLNEDTLDRKLLPVYFADFFLRKNRGLNFSLLHTEANGLVFVLDDMPVLYCNRG